MKIRNSQTGFSHAALVVLLVIVIAGVGFVGYRIGTNKKESKTTITTATNSSAKSETQASKIPDGFVAYENKELGFKLAYPKTWGDAKDESSVPGDGSKKSYFIRFQNVNVQISALPKDTCPGGDSPSTSTSQGWFKKDSKFYVTWCKYSKDYNGSDSLVNFGNSTPESISQLAIFYYEPKAGSLGDSGTHPQATGLVNLTKNQSYSGFSLIRQWEDKEKLNNDQVVQEFKQVLKTVEEL